MVQDNDNDPLGWRERSVYPDGGWILFVRCDVATTAQHVAALCEGQYGARDAAWLIPDPDPPDPNYPFLKGKIGFMSMTGRIVNTPWFVVEAAQIAFPATLSGNRISFRAPIPDGITVIEMILSELSPPYHARTTVTFKAYLVDLHVIEFLDKALDEFWDDYPERTKSHYELYRFPGVSDSLLWKEPGEERIDALLVKLEANGFKLKKETIPNPEVRQAERELTERWESYDVQRVIEMSERGIPIPQIAEATVSSPATVKRIRKTAARAGKLTLKPRPKKTNQTK